MRSQMTLGGLGVGRGMFHRGGPLPLRPFPRCLPSEQANEFREHRVHGSASPPRESGSTAGAAASR